MRWTVAVITPHPEATLIRFSEVPETPWANGAGLTQVLASAVTTAGVTLWRISIATIAGASDFSPLPGLDRRLMNLGGVPLRLRRGRDVLTVGPTAVVSFAGEESVAVVAGSGHDLNVMTARDRARSRLGIVRLNGARSFLGGSGSVIAVVALEDGLTSVIDGEHRALRRLDTVLGDHVELRGDGEAALIRISVDG